MSDIKETLRYKELFEHAAKENGALRARIKELKSGVETLKDCAVSDAAIRLELKEKIQRREAEVKALQAEVKRLWEALEEAKGGCDE